LCPDPKISKISDPKILTLKFDGTMVFEIVSCKKKEILEHLRFLNISAQTLGLKD